MELENSKAGDRQAQKLRLSGKWLWRMVWLVIPSVLSGLLSSEAVAGWSTGVYIAGLLLGVLTELARGGILLRLAPAEERYGKAGMFCLTAVALRTASAALGQSEIFYLLLSGVLLVATLLEKYHEYRAHAALESEIDPVRAARWESLWKWFIGISALLLAGLLMAVLLPLPGAAVLVVASVAMGILRIAEPVLLWSMARGIRSCQVGPDTEK